MFFEKTFLQNGPDFELRVYNENNMDSILSVVKILKNTIKEKTGMTPINKFKENDFVMLKYDAVKLSLYGITPAKLISVLRSKLKNYHIGFYNAFNQQIPVVISERDKTLQEVIAHETILNNDRMEIPLKAFIKAETNLHPYELTSGSDGEFFALQYKLENISLKETEKKIEGILKIHFPKLNYNFRGQVYENNRLIKELSLILIISLLLLYFILAAQFESLLQPLIVLLELPIDIAGAILFLKLFGGSLNIMSAIGIIVMTGIVINDSILKIDTINRLRRDEGMKLMDAIHEGGNRRLRPIIMTSVTTILALTPVSLGHSMGVELQRPLALTIIGGLGIGTFVSLFFIPLAYWFIYRKSEKSLVK